MFDPYPEDYPDDDLYDEGYDKEYDDLMAAPMYNVQGHSSDERSGYGMLWLFLLLACKMHSQAPQGVPECPEHYKRNVEADMTMSPYGRLSEEEAAVGVYYWLAVLGGLFFGLLLSTLLFGRI